MATEQEIDDTVQGTDRPSVDTQNPAEDEHSDTNTPAPGSAVDENIDVSVPPVDSGSDERYKNSQARMTQALQESADLRREVATLQAQVASMQGQAQTNTQAPASTVDPFIEDPALAKLRSEYPDFAVPIVDALERQQKVISDLRTRGEEVATSAEENRKSSFIQSVKAAHPDMDSVVTSDDFKGWLYRQAPFVQDAVVNGDAASAIQVLGMYKQGNQQPDTRAELLDAAKQVATPAVGRNTQAPVAAKEPQFTRQQISEMTPEEFEKNESAIDKAMAVGGIA
ncbi:MAG: hypothetical protein KAG66_00455 [Methylococcales bacterium]|nr:hypothetical protein [Methylococcales bacterium]